MSRLTQSIHLCFGLPLFLPPGGTISRVFLPTYSCSRLFSWPNYLSLAFLQLSVLFSTFSLSLMSSFLTRSLGVWPHAHLHIFISVTSFLHVGASDWQCLLHLKHRKCFGNIKFIQTSGYRFICACIKNQPSDTIFG